MSDLYKKVAKTKSDQKTTITLVDGTVIGGGKATIMAGPCAVESEDQVSRIAKIVKDGGVDILRGGAFKPRTSPESFAPVAKDLRELNLLIRGQG